jgi:hypothetical protein
MSRSWKIAVVIVLLSGFIGCNRQDRLQNEVIMLQDRTIPPDAKRIERLELIRTKHGATLRGVLKVIVIGAHIQRG